MKKIFIMYMLLSLALLGCEGSSDSAKQNLDQDQGELASEIEKAANSASEKIDIFSTQFEKISAVIQEKYQELAPKIGELVDTLKQKSNELSKELEKAKQEAAEKTEE